jgi:DNA-binding SARP family transcriptional activator
MRALSPAGRQYELCRRILRDELGIEPSDGLRKLMQRILAGSACE